MTPTSVFALGRMRHLDLLALWLRANWGTDSPGIFVMGAASKEALIAAILHPVRSPHTARLARYKPAA